MARCFYCLGAHDTGQCISHATEKIVSAEKDSARASVEATIESSTKLSEIISETGYRTQEAVEGLTWELSSKLEEIHSAIYKLHDFLDWAHEETMWRMEKQIELLTGIHNMIKNPRATQSNELYKMGIESFKVGRLSDALKLLKEARELNPGDYRILITMGHIYERYNNNEAALECFKAAIDYARTNDYKRDALLLACRTLRCLGQNDEAYVLAKEATSISARYSPAWYELAGCTADKLK